MRKLILTEFITLDEVIQNPHLWSFDYWNEEIAKFKRDGLFNCGGLVLGRITYNGFADTWPSMEDKFADRMNSIPKYVVSQTLKSATWNDTTIVNNNFEQEIIKIKQSDGKDLLIS